MIPQELQVYRQWVVASKEDKKPLSPNTLKPASVTNSKTWGTYEQALAASDKNNLEIGFVLTDNDPYVIIDLDNKAANPATAKALKLHELILANFKTYTEKSVSGRGYHLICKGSCEAKRTAWTEVYYKERFFILTGERTNDYEIEERQELINYLLQTLEGSHTEKPAAAATGLVERIKNANNGAKFTKLYEGDFSDYPSQSEADYALLSMLCFYTDDNAEVAQVFKSSALGKRDKATDSYIEKQIAKIRKKDGPVINIAALSIPGTVKAELPAIKPALPVIKPVPPEEKFNVSYPSGFVGELAKHFYSNAVRPSVEVSLAASLALCAGILGRQFNISNTGLNNYFILIGKTGVGKEGAASAIDDIVSEIKKDCPDINMFIGPSGFASGQALVKALDTSNCFVSCLGEIGITLSSICDPKASAHLAMYKKVLLDLYGKSGKTKTLRPSVYADSVKNTKAIEAPNVTILGEGNPESFYGTLELQHISEGLVPRFIIIPCQDNRPERNKVRNNGLADKIKSTLIEFVTVASSMHASHSFADVALSKQAEVALDAFDKKADSYINSNSGEVVAQLWNRAHLKALKLAGLLAVTNNIHQPTVTAADADWAIDFVTKEITIASNRFNSGDFGNGDSKQEAEIKKAVIDYLKMPANKRTNYGVGHTLAVSPIVPYSYLRKRLRILTCFKNDKMGANRALEQRLIDMCKDGRLEKISKEHMMSKYASDIEAYYPGKEF